MKNISVLDCTLRDGGYCNQWQFGFDNIKKITYGLSDAGIDIIECGFITSKVCYDKDVTRFTKVEQISEFIPNDRSGKLYVNMLNYGEYNVDELPQCDGNSIDGIRLAFHKNDIKEALEVGKKIKEKGYLLFVQPMVSLNYTDEEFIALINICNDIKPYAFYIVDSFGVMKKKDLIRLFYLVEHNLDQNIRIGFHSHNNMQLAYSNAQALVDLRTNRTLLIDSSVFGMGRGAGNLNTELFVEYLNDSHGTNYKIKPLFSIIDEVLNGFYQQNYWGYSLPNYLSASHNSHPNYASYLCDKNTLTVEDMDNIFSMMDDEKRNIFDKKYIEQLYQKYLSADVTQDKHSEDFKSMVEGKTILLIAPGKSVESELDKIKEFVDNKDVISISVNFDYEHVDVDYIFVGNLRRYKDIDKSKKDKCIVTSNITVDNIYLKVSYSELLNKYDMVRDNAGMMAVNMLMKYGAEKIYLAGFDGYSHDTDNNYGDTKMQIVARNAVLDAMNIGMQSVLQEYAQTMDIQFLTTPRFISI